MVTIDLTNAEAWDRGSGVRDQGSGVGDQGSGIRDKIKGQGQHQG